MGELGDGRRLARTVDAYHQHHMRARESGDLQRLGDGAEDFGDLFSHDRAQPRLVERLLITAFTNARSDAGGGGWAEIGRDQRFFKFAERAFVKLDARADQPRQLIAQAPRRSGKTPPQPPKPAPAPNN